MRASRTFEVSPRLWGYAQGRKEAFRPERVAFKELVRNLANLEGIPQEVTEEMDLKIYVVVLWKKTARIDGKNVYALIEDALWTKDRGVAAGEWRRSIHQGEEKAIVTVKWEEA